MITYSDLGITPPITSKKVLSDQLFAKKKQLIVRQNSNDLEKRAKAEKLLGVTSAIEFILDGVEDEKYLDLVVRTCAVIADLGNSPVEYQNHILAAVNGNVDEIRFIWNYLVSNGCQQEFAEWLQIASKYGVDVNYTDIGYSLFVNGDYMGAIEWYEKARKKGAIDSNNMLNLYYAYLNTQNKSKAIEIIKELSNNGVVEAKRILASAYENGDGVEKDLNQAYRLYQQLFAMGDTSIEANLRRLETTLNIDSNRAQNSGGPNNPEKPVLVHKNSGTSNNQTADKIFAAADSLEDNAAKAIEKTKSTLNDKKKLPLIIGAIIAIIVVYSIINSTVLDRTKVDLVSNLDEPVFIGADGYGEIEDLEYYLENCVNVDCYVSGKNDWQRIDAFRDSLTYEIDPTGELSNGDSVTVRAVYDNAVAKKLHIDVEKSERSFEVEGLLVRYADASELKEEDVAAFVDYSKDYMIQNLDEDDTYVGLKALLFVREEEITNGANYDQYDDEIFAIFEYKEKWSDEVNTRYYVTELRPFYPSMHYSGNIDRLINESEASFNNWTDSQETLNGVIEDIKKDHIRDVVEEVDASAYQ